MIIIVIRQYLFHAYTSLLRFDIKIIVITIRPFCDIITICNIIILLSFRCHCCTATWEVFDEWTNLLFHRKCLKMFISPSSSCIHIIQIMLICVPCRWCRYRYERAMQNEKRQNARKALIIDRNCFVFARVFSRDHLVGL